MIVVNVRFTVNTKQEALELLKKVKGFVERDKISANDDKIAITTQELNTIKLDEIESTP